MGSLASKAPANDVRAVASRTQKDAQDQELPPGLQLSGRGPSPISLVAPRA